MKNKLLLTLLFLPAVFAAANVSLETVNSTIVSLPSVASNIPILINPFSVLVNNNVVQGATSVPASVTSIFGNKELVISRANLSLSISDAGVNVIVSVPNPNILVVESSMFIESDNNRYEIRVMPSDAIVIANAAKITNLSIITSASAIKYIVEDNREVKLFGLFPVNITVSSMIDAFSGEIDSVKRPWWAVFSFN